MTEKTTISTDLLDRAIRFASDAHRNTPRKGTMIPYILHPLEAAAIVASVTEDIEVIAAAVLHDTVEDNKSISLDDIEQQFGTRIRNLVAAESEAKEEDKAGSWFRRKDATIRHLKEHASEEERIIALGDKLSNIRAMYKDQQQVGDALWERFNQKDKHQHELYYQSVAQALTSLSGHPAHKEYCDLMNRVFHV